MYISELYVYPIKSLRPTKLNQATFTRHGIQYDRCFMLLKKQAADSDDNTRDGTESKPTLRNMHVTYFPQMSLFLTDIVLSDDNDDDDEDDQRGSQDKKKIIVTYQPPPVSENKPRRTLEIPLEPDVRELAEVPVTMHQSPMMGYVMEQRYSDWFSECFGFPVVLVYTGANRRRVLGSVNPQTTTTTPSLPLPDNKEGWLSTVFSYVSPRPHAVEEDTTEDELKKKQKQKKDEEILTFADCASYMVVNRESVNNVADRFGSDGQTPTVVDVDVTRFRPNIVIGGTEKAWDEDFWGELTVDSATGETVRVILTANCIRCRSLDVDYETGGFHQMDGGVIYKKLNTDRRVDKGAKYKPVFGRYGFLKEDSVATIRVGDIVNVSKRIDERTVFEWPGL